MFIIGYTNQKCLDLEVKTQGQRSPTMVRNTSSGDGLPTCQIWKACLERQKSYNPDTICYGRTDGQTDHYSAYVWDMLGRRVQAVAPPVQNLR
jgi:hypothetical protein